MLAHSAFANRIVNCLNALVSTLAQPLLPTLLLPLLLTLFLSLFSSDVMADENQNLINQQDWITRNQQNILEEKKRDTELETIRKERERKKKEEMEKQEQSKISGKTARCLAVKEVRLLGADLISPRQREKFISPFLAKCFEATALSELIKSIHDYYQNSGYITTQVIVPKQNLQNGILELQIIEGKIEKISLGKNGWRDKMQEFTAFGNAEGKALNIHGINQGIYQINRLQSNAAVMKIEPGSADGLSKINIENNKKFPARFTIGRDNLGNKFTGIQRTNFSSSFDNLLSLNDNTNLSYSTNAHDDSQIKDIKSFSGGISLPFKFNSFSFDYSHSEFKGQNVGQNATTTLTGFSEQKKFTIDHVFLSQTNLRISANASLTAKESASYLSGEKIATSERKLSILNAGFAISYYLDDSTHIYLKPSYSRGLKVLNAKQDQKNISAETPKAQFEIFKLYASISKKFTLPKTNFPLTFSSEMDSQFAKETLFGSEQFSVGGYYSVRGFRENYINGDSGYYFRNKLGFNLKQFRFEPFYDYGYIKNKYNGTDGRLAGAGLKSIFENRYFNAALTYSWAVNKSRLITSTEKENKLVYFEISASCC